MNAVSAHGTGSMTLCLEPGTYEASRNVPDPVSGVSHSLLGMIRQFTVTD
jgi:hypothetical protein